MTSETRDQCVLTLLSEGGTRLSVTNPGKTSRDHGLEPGERIFAWHKHIAPQQLIMNKKLEEWEGSHNV